MEFHVILKKLRTQASLTQKQLGEKIGVTKSVISYYELQERVPSPEVLIKIASVFHVTTDYLLGLEKVPSIDVSGLEYNDIIVIKELIELLREKNRH